MRIHVLAPFDWSAIGSIGGGPRDGLSTAQRFPMAFNSIPYQEPIPSEWYYGRVAETAARRLPRHVATARLADGTLIPRILNKISPADRPSASDVARIIRVIQ